MIFSRRALQLLALTSAVNAFVLRSPRSTASVKSESLTESHITQLAATSYVDDAAETDSEGESSNDSTSKNSPTYEYLEDSSLKEPESYLEDMASVSDTGSNSESDKTDSTASLPQKYLEDMAVDNISSEVAASGDEHEDTDATEESDNNVLGEENDKNLAALLRIAASTGRGEFANKSQKDQARDLIASLEANNPTPEPTNSSMINGRWELVYSSTQLFRSSPFFMAGRAVCSTKDQADQYDWFCDMHRKALAVSNIGTVRQVISPTLMISEFEVKVGAVPFLNDFTPFSYSGGLPATIDGSIVSQADITPTDDGKSWELLMDTVQIKGSNIPGLRTILDNGLQLQSRGLGSFLESNLNGYTNPRPIFETTFLTDSIRISRDQDGKVFVYAKESEESTPTDYTKVEADLGFLELLGGFNDAIMKFYI
mmetsp:Transcript_27181/g.63660  ORF Transcript_27181/g.63660 Transcript_27181/m.63660 type:complete len:428 (+) Transcript_27181:294-1577(+)